MILSIIVPVYNVAQYLPKCLDSLLNQNIDRNNYEIIVINDGSTDNCGEIVGEYMELYSNIILISQNNQGLSSARNSGIKVAKGKYIQFVDSDDYIESNVEKALVEKMERENLDILRFKYQNINEQYNVFIPNKIRNTFVDYSDDVCDGFSFLTERLGFGCYAWQFMLRTELVKSISLFKEGIYFEDTEWTPRILLKAQRVTSVDTIVYNYFVRVGSITNGKTIEMKRKVIDDKISLIKSLTRQMDCVCDKRWYKGMISSLVISVLGCIADDFYSERRRYFKSLYNARVFPISSFHLNSSSLRKLRVINISPLLFCFCYRLKNR